MIHISSFECLLQEEVSALSPQVTYLDRHRIILNVDNSAMKQRIAALAQEKLFKDGEFLGQLVWV